MTITNINTTKRYFHSRFLKIKSFQTTNETRRAHQRKDQVQSLAQHNESTARGKSNLVMAGVLDGSAAYSQDGTAEDAAASLAGEVGCDGPWMSNWHEEDGYEEQWQDWSSGGWPSPEQHQADHDADPMHA